MTQELWKWGFRNLDDMLGGSQPAEPEVALLLRKHANLTMKQFRLATLLFMAMKQVIVKAWRTPSLHTSKGLARMRYFRVNDKLTALLQIGSRHMKPYGHRGWKYIYLRASMPHFWG